MCDVRKDLSDHGLHYAGLIRSGGPCPSNCRYRHEVGHVHAYIDHDIEKFVVYSFIVGDQIVKNGKAGSRNDTLRGRMRGEANTINVSWLFAEGRLISTARWQYRKLDVFKREAPVVIRLQQEIEVWAGAFTDSTFEDKERQLNAKYNPPWVDRHG